MKRAHTEMEGRLLLDIVVREGPAILELLAGEDEALLVRRDTLLVLDLALDVINRITGLDFEGDWRGMSESALRTGETEYALVLPVSVLTKICMPPRNLSTRWRVDSFWML
jgi:hypothetical protein